MSEAPEAEDSAGGGTRGLASDGSGAGETGMASAPEGATDAPAGVPPGWEGILSPGERILWQGRPSGRVLWSDLIGARSGFGLVFTAFALFWMAMAGTMASGTGPFGLIFPLFGLPFVAVGLWLVIGHVLWDAGQRRRTWYTLTDRAAFIATERGGTRHLDRHPVGPDMPLSYEETGGEGTIWFAEEVTHVPAREIRTRTGYRRRGASTTRRRIGFRLIPDGRRVFGLMRGLVEAAEPGTGG